MYIRTSDRLGQASLTEPDFLDVLKKAAEAAYAPSPLVTGDILKKAVAGKAIAAGAPLFRRAKAILKPAIPREKTCWIQTVLNKTSGENLVPDGLYGPKTREAVRQFQRRSGLSADGIVGPRTNTALIQIALNHIAQASLLPVDGVMDARMQQEIKRFQSENNLAPDGIVGPRTRAAMVTALGGRCIVSRPGKRPPHPPIDDGPLCDRPRFEMEKQACREQTLKNIAGCAIDLGIAPAAALGFAAAAFAATGLPGLLLAAGAAGITVEFIKVKLAICAFRELQRLKECVEAAKTHCL